MESLINYGWFIYMALCIAVVLYLTRTNSGKEQFNEDIKYLVFDENDKDNMTPEEFAKAQAVLKSQTELREQHLAKKNKSV